MMGAGQSIALTDISTADLIRRPRAARVAAVTASIADEGLRTPLELSPLSGKHGPRYSLVRGWVRLQALQALGAVELSPDQYVIRKSGKAERRAREVDDNLSQDGCTVLDRARYLATAKALYEVAAPQAGHGRARKGDFQVAKFGDLKRELPNLATLNRFTADAAARYGLQERAVQRLCTIGERIDAEAAELLADSEWADHQSGLETLSRAEPTHQRDAAKLLIREENPVASVAEALAIVLGTPAVAADPVKKAWSTVVGNWDRLGARDQRELLRTLPLPTGVRLVFDDEVEA